MTRARLAIVALAVTVLAACGEKPQTKGNDAKKSDIPAYKGGQTPYAAAGWKPGESGSWEEQMRVRVRHQNEYVRVD